MVHVALGVDRRERVDDLLIAAWAERRDREDLGLSAGEHGRAVRARENPDLDGQLADVLGAAAIRTQVLLSHRLAELILEKLLVYGADLVDRERRAVAGGELRDGLELQLVEPRLALCLVRVAELRAKALAQEGSDRPQAGWVCDHLDVLHLRLAGGALKVHLGVADLLDAFLREPESLDQEVFADLLRPGLHHHDRVARARDDEVEGALLHLLDGRVEGELAIHRADANAADGSLERSVRDGQRGGRRVHRKDVVVVLLIGRPGRDDDLDVVSEALRKERPDRPIGETRGEDALLRGTAFAARERAGDLACGIEPLFEVDGEREEVDPGADRFRDGRRGEHDRVAVLDRDRAARLLRVLPCLEGERLSVDGRLGTGNWHVVVDLGCL